jgi:hypothetical protein
MTEEERVKQAKLMKDALNDMAYEVERQTLLAKVCRIRYTALLKEGFTPGQALVLCHDSLKATSA